MVRIDQPHTRKWLKLSDGETADWQLYLTRQTAEIYQSEQ